MSEHKFNFPSQKKSFSSKTKSWRKECVDALDNSGYFESENIRKSYRNKVVNYDLYNGKFNVDDMKAFLNPEDIKSLNTESSPPSVVNFGIAAPRIDVLVGEEAKRAFEFRAVVTNPLSISQKSENRKNDLLKSLTEFIKSSEQDEEKLKQKLESLQNYYTYSWQDLKEKQSNDLLQYLFAKQRLGIVFNDGMKDALISSEEIYQLEIVANEPVMKRVNPLHIHWLRSGFSSDIQDADLIVLDEYWSPGKIVDHFHDELKGSDIDKLEKGYVATGGSSNTDPFVGNRNAEPMFVGNEILEGKVIDDYIGLMEINGSKINRAYDVNGNIRVLRVYWKSFRKLLKVKSYDENGMEVYDLHDETYKIKEDEGETSTTIWVNEWWEGTKIGHDIYVKMQPKKVQYRDADNPSKCYPGFVGGAYAVNNTEGRTLMDRLKQFEYLYSVVHDRLNKSLAKNKGKVLMLDFASIPKGWGVEQWMHYIDKMGVAVVDSFKEGSKGAATGRLAGSLNNASKGYIDLETGAYISGHISLLQFIRNEMGQISGVTDQRLGQTQSRETVGGIERSISQSNHITEWYYTKHEDIKLRALEGLLETAKIAYKGKSISKQFILNDGSIQMLNLDGDEFSNSSYGVVVTSSNRYNELNQKLERLADLGLQSSSISFDTAMDIYVSNSLAEKKNLIKTSEAKKRQAESESNQARAKEYEAKLKVEQEFKSRELDIKELETEVKLAIGMNDNAAMAKLQLDIQRRKDDIEKFEKTLAENKRQFNEKLQFDKTVKRSTSNK